MEWETELRQAGSYSLGSAVACIIDSGRQPDFRMNPACGKQFNLIFASQQIIVNIFMSRFFLKTKYNM